MTTITADISSISPVPVLKVDGANWPIFETRFRHFAKSKNIWDHFDGSVSRPAPRKLNLISGTKTRMKLTITLHSSSRIIPSCRLTGLDTVAGMWGWVTNEFTAMSAHVIVQSDFDNLNYGENGNVHTHLEQLKLKYKGLVAVGVKLTNSQYATRIINSLPRTYQRYLLFFFGQSHADGDQHRTHRRCSAGSSSACKRL
jgi:hypothetical protein